MTFLFEHFMICLLLVGVQGLAALPWVVVLHSGSVGEPKRQTFDEGWVRILGGGVLVGLLMATALSFYMGLSQSHEPQQYYGGVYGAVLHIQLTIDAFILFFALLLLIWPKVAAVALAAFREAWRQPMFWMLLLLSLAFMFLMPFIPYFTFGEDFKMVKELGFGVIMLVSVLFGVLVASISISEEIEGRTAITLLSKPVSRGQFLVGKYLGILLAALMLTATLGWFFDGILLFKLSYDHEPVILSGESNTTLDDWTADWTVRCGETPAFFLRGAGFWLLHVGIVLPGLILGSCQVMVMVAIAVALATRLPMIANLVICEVIFFLGHLAPILKQVTANRTESQYALVRFLAQLFDTLLPSLELFNLGPTIARDTPPEIGPFAWYVGEVTSYALLYTGIALLAGLIFFEDRDLA